MLKVSLAFCTCLCLIPLSASADQVNRFAAQTVLYQSEDWVGDNTFTNGIEGPAVSKNGVLYVVNYLEQGTIGRVVGKNKFKLFVKLANNSIGNGIRFNQRGDMYIADYVNHSVLKISEQHLSRRQLEHSLVEVHGHSSLMNQPNDLAIMTNGTLFASDPNWSNNSGNLWRIDTNGELVLLEKSMGTTNGIEVSPDNKTLYVNESAQRTIWQYQLSANGSVSSKKLLIRFKDYGLDGMRADDQGNLYIARYGKGVVAVVSPKGELLREVKLKGEFPTNVAFGGKDGKTVFVTMQKRGAIERFISEFPGRSFN